MYFNSNESRFHLPRGFENNDDFLTMQHLMLFNYRVLVLPYTVYSIAVQLGFTSQVFTSIYTDTWIHV